MSAPDSTVFQANFKVGNDLFNVYASNGSEMEELLDFFQESLLPKITAINSATSGAAAVAAAIPVAPSATQTFANAAMAQPQAPVGQVMCDCGVPAKRIEAGVSKATGRPYKAFYACANPDRQQQCQFKAQG